MASPVQAELDESTRMRLGIRELFFDVDGEQLVQQAKAARHSHFADLAKGLPSSIYTIPLLPSATRSNPDLEFGLIRNPELFGGGGMNLWCSHSHGEPFVHLAKVVSNRSSRWHLFEHGAILEFDDADSDTYVIMLAMQMVKTLISAFDIHGVDLAVTEQSAFVSNSEIRDGKPSDRIDSL